jgi:effector-binding domain-containing protein
MPKISVSKHIHINAPIAKVFSVITDFSTWMAWSPWLIMDPETQVNVAEDKKSYAWEGRRTGSGNMKIVSEQENTSVEIALTFLKPWKSTAKVYFYLIEAGDQTEVKWTMDSSLPFFMFWIKKMMETFIGMDYDRGLRMLKDYIEDGKVHSKLNFIGKETLSAQEFIGISTSCSMDEMGKKMSEDMPRILAFITENEIEIGGAPFTQYNKWDLKNGRVEYTSGVPVKSAPSKLPTGFSGGEIPETTVYTVEHVGPYQHLGNAWTTLYTMQRGKEIAVRKNINPFETYMNNPMEVDAKELVTRVSFPLK